MAERDRQHIALRREKQHNTFTKIIRRNKQPGLCVHQIKQNITKMFSKMLFHKASHWQVSSHRCAVDEQREREREKSILIYTPPLLSLMLEGLGRRDATVIIFTSAFWFTSIFRCILFFFFFLVEEIQFHFVLVSILSVGNTAKAPNGSHSIPPVCDWPALTSLRH